MTLTTTHLRLALLVIGLLGAAVAGLLWWGGLPTAPLSPLQQGLVTTAAAVAAAAPLLGAALPSTRIERMSSAAFPVLALFGFGVLFTDALDVFPLRILVIAGVVLSLAAVVMALFGGAERTEAADGADRTAHRFH